MGGSNVFLENLKIATQSADPSHLSMEKMPKAVFFSFLFIPLSVAMFPHVFQHWLTARSAESFKLPIIMHPVFILIVWAPCVLLGVWASGENSGVPAALAGMGPEKFNKVLPTLVKLHAGDVLGGLLSAGILAAIMSSLDSQFLCLGTVFTEDVVRHYGGRERYSDAQVVRLARYFVVGVVVLTYLLSLLLPGSVFTLGLWSFSGFTGLVPLVFAAIYWRRLTAAGAIASVATTVGCWTVLFIRGRWQTLYLSRAAPLHGRFDYYSQNATRRHHFRGFCLHPGGGFTAHATSRTRNTRQVLLILTCLPVIFS